MSYSSNRWGGGDTFVTETPTTTLHPPAYQQYQVNGAEDSLRRAARAIWYLALIIAGVCVNLALVLIGLGVVVGTIAAIFGG